MKSIYTEKDIQKFLYEHGILWRGEKFEASPYNGIPAIVNLFNRNENFEVYLDIGYLTFKIFYIDCNICYQETTWYKSLYKDLSLEWTKFLLKKYPISKEIIIETIKKEKQYILENAKKEIEPLQNKITKIKESAKKKISYWTKLETTLNHKLSKCNDNQNSIDTKNLKNIDRLLF